MTAVMPLEPTLGRCRRCGKLSSLAAAFCPRCGIALRDVSPGLQAEILDDEPATGNWEILDSASPRPWPVMPMPAIPVIPKAPSLPFAPIAPNWSASRSFKKRRAWLPILICFILIRSMASWSASSSNARSVRTPSPAIHATPVVYPTPGNSSHVRH